MKQTIRLSNLILLTISTVLSVASCHALYAPEDIRQNPSIKPKQAINNNTKTAHNETYNVDCSVDLPHLVEVCAKPLMDMITGTIEKWPRNVKDTQELCDSFITTERCIRDVGRKCAKGLHKTIISTLSSAVQRVRKRECVKQKLPDLLKLTNCMEKVQAPLQNMVSNITNRLVVIDTQITNLDQKTSAVCCMVNVIEQDIKNLYAPKCPKEGEITVRMYRGVLEEVIELICRSPKCNDFLRGHKVSRSKTTDGIIAILLRIVFSLGE